MNLDKYFKNDFEKIYFSGLVNKKESKPEIIRIHTSDAPSEVYPIAIAPSEIFNNQPIHFYENIKEKYKTKTQVDACVWLKKMHGGIGTSIKRDTYLKKRNIASIGAKGTDLFIRTSEGDLSIAEAQIIQAKKKLKSFKKIIYQDILNEDITSKIESVWKNVDAGEVIHTSSLIQRNFPSFNANNELTDERLAPAGHGFIGYELLLSIYNGQIPNEDNLICCIGNGEDLSSTPDKSVVNWMISENIPICMLTTTKTQNDVKGGQIAIRKENGKSHFTIIEKAQAEQAQQLELFSKIGLQIKQRDAFFNTNLVLVNVSCLKNLFANISYEELTKNALPDLILNKKMQNSKEFHQIEGALGSVILNLDKFWREKFNKPIVNILNVGRENRTRFFSPIKSSFDFFMQFHSDRFTFNEKTFHLKNNNPGVLPIVNLPSEYSDLQNVIDDFEGSKIIDLEEIKLTKRYSFKNKTLSGVIAQ